MGKPTDAQKIAFLAHLEHVYCTEVARLAGFPGTTVKDLKACTEALKTSHTKQGLQPPTLEELITRKPGSGLKPRVLIKQITGLLKACTLNKKQRK